MFTALSVYSLIVFESGVKPISLMYSVRAIISTCNIPITISMYEVGKREPDFETEEKIADFFNTDLNILRGRDTEQCSQSGHGIIIPVLGRVAAGIPLTAAEYIIDTEEIPQAMAADGEYFCLQVKGDSMEPKISNGDVVIVRKQPDADDGDLVIALINGDDAVVKRLKKYEDGIGLISSNPTYAPMYFSNEEIESKPVEIIGKVKELRAKF